MWIMILSNFRQQNATLLLKKKGNTLDEEGRK